MAEQAAQVVEMFLIGGRFLAREALPLLFEFRPDHLRSLVRRGTRDKARIET
jgi:hypothetical protein